MTQTASKSSQIAARLGSTPRNAGTRVLTIDATVRRITLAGGGWRLWGSAGAAYYAVREASDAAGTLMSGESAAPSTSELAAAAAGAPGAGLAWDAAQTVTGLRVPTDTTLYAEIAVRRGAFVNLYVRAPGGATTAILEGPFDAPDVYES